MLRSTLSYLSFGLVSESVESEVAEVPVPEVESKVEVTSPVEDNWVILGQDLTVSLFVPLYFRFQTALHLCAYLYDRWSHLKLIFFKNAYSRIQSASRPIKFKGSLGQIQGRSKSDPTLSDIDFKNEMA